MREGGGVVSNKPLLTVTDMATKIDSYSRGLSGSVAALGCAGNL